MSWVLLLQYRPLSRRAREARSVRALPYLHSIQFPVAVIQQQGSIQPRSRKRKKPSFHSDPAAASHSCYLPECTKQWKQLQNSCKNSCFSLSFNVLVLKKHNLRSKLASGMSMLFLPTIKVQFMAVQHDNQLKTLAKLSKPKS